MFFLFLILYQLYKPYSNYEGLQNRRYERYDEDDSLVLAKKNAGNIDALKSQFDDISDIKIDFNVAQEKINSLESQVNDLVSSQEQYAKDMIGTSPPEITGAV